MQKKALRARDRCTALHGGRERSVGNAQEQWWVGGRISLTVSWQYFHLFRIDRGVYKQEKCVCAGVSWCLWANMGQRESGPRAAVRWHAHLQRLPPKCSTYSWELQIIQNCEDHYDRQWQALFRNGKYVSEFYETRALKPFDSQMKPKLIWELTDVILLAEELDGGGDGWGIACVLTIELFVTDWQRSGRQRQEKK